MPAKMSGLGPYSGDRRDISVGRDGAHVVIEVEEGAIMLTPDQAAALADGLKQQASFAGQASHLTGKFDLPPKDERADLRTSRD